jgi:tryptophanyl-tRNA synthetase
MRALSGIKPTGPLHLGNLEGAVRAWVELQRAGELFCMIANWHAYTIPPPSPALVKQWTFDMAVDLLAAGVDPERAVLFVQSDVKEHAELYLLLSTVTPVAWLERVPTYKQLSEGERARSSPAHALLGYPVLQAADILLYRATTVPVGSDQLPHLELVREIARRFNHLYGATLAEPEALLGTAPIVPGLDGAKMSKDRGNTINLRDTPEETTQKIASAFTTPTKIRATDAGVPERCAVCQLRKLYDSTGYLRSWEEDRRGERGCSANKAELAVIVNEALGGARERRRALEGKPGRVDEILRAGAEKARVVARETIADVRRAMALDRP